ncbi:cupredoxin domain-containing protein [Streptomyces sp. NBC_00344]|uniref:cupredoxin domain-containing protein n=1 Tax=Streptomyces sp. NBC_00344 TaxID=2975720 RepID=UPI002E1AF242
MKTRCARTAAAVGLAVTAAAAGGCSQATSGTHAQAPVASSAASAEPLAAASSATMPSKIMTVGADGLGKIIVDGKGRTLYLFSGDRSAKPTCTGTCAKAWPPAKVEARPTAGKGAKSSLLGTTTRSDGSKQATYHHHPLYYFSKDKKAGDTGGQAVKAFHGQWFVLDPAGNKITKEVPSNSRARIVIKNFKYAPSSLTVKPGTTVTVVNQDSVTHTVTAKDKSFDTGNVAAGKTVSFKAPSKAGSHPYNCTIHPYMKGTLTVG